MPEGTPAPESASQGPQIPGMHPKVHETLIQHYSPEIIEKQRGQYGTHEDFLKAAEAEAKRIDAIKTEERVRANAALPEKERLETAEKLIGPLSDEQKETVKKMHQVEGAGVYNYTRPQIAEKARIGAEKTESGERVFNKEQRRALMEAGLVGRLTPAEYAALGIDLAPFDSDPKLKRIVTNVKTTGEAGNADEVFFSNKIAQVRKLDEAAEVDGDLAQNLETSLQVGFRQVDDRLLPHSERVSLEQLARREGGSKFSMAKMVYEYYMAQPIPIDQSLRNELQRRKDQSKAELERLEQRAEQHPTKPVKEMKREILKSYKRIKETKVKELQGGGREAVIEHEAARGLNQEKIWDESIELAPLKSTFGGLSQYLWEGVHTAIAYEEKAVDRISRHIKNPFAERLFAEIKRLRARDRMSTKEKRYTQAESWYGGRLITIFTWPESSREMILSAMDWVKDRIAAVGERDPSKTNSFLEEIRNEGPMLLQNSLFRINSEPVLVAELGGEIIETNPEYQRAIAFTEGPPDVFGNEKIMKKGNIEFGPQAKERFAAKFLENFNAMFLENKYAANLMHRLSTYKDGTYWTGHDWHTDKALEGSIKDYRAEIQEKLIDEAATQDFFTESIFVANQDLFSKEPQAGEEDVRLIRNAEDVEDVRLVYKGFFELREKYKLQYSANDPLERLLLDPDNEIRQRITVTGDTKALERHNLRVGVFRRTKELLDREEGLSFITRAEIARIEKYRRRFLTEDELSDLDEARKNQRRARIRQLNPAYSPVEIETELQRERRDARQESIRDRIRARMGVLSQRESYFAGRSASALVQFDQAKQNGVLAECDRIAWDWVKDYNSHRIKIHQPRWYPSGWDKVRIKIDRAAKVIDRSLTEEERAAMYEKAYLPQMAANDIEGQERVNDLIKGRVEDARFGFELARSFGVFMMESSLLGGMRIRMVMPKGHPQAGEYTGRLADDETSLLLGLIREKIDPQTGLVMKDAQGKVVYETVDPERKSLRIWDVIEARSTKAIADEEKEIKPLKETKSQAELARNMAILSGDQTAINATTKPLEEATKALGEKLALCQFVITHAFKAKRLVDGRLPTWPHTSALDNSGIKEFGAILAEYGVMVAPGIRFADFKKEIYEFLERERRGLISEMDRATKEFMLGKYPFYELDMDGNIVTEQAKDKDGHLVNLPNRQPKMVPIPAVSLFTMSNDWGEPGEMDDRMRVVNKGDVAENTMVTEVEYNLSTSGGVKFTEYIPFARLNFFPLGVPLGSRSIWNLNNYIKRRNEVEAHKQKLIDPKDMPLNAKAQAAAYLARKALTGGSLGEGKSTKGFLMEPFNGAFTIADWFRKTAEKYDLNDIIPMKNTKNYISLMEDMRGGKVLLEDPKLELLRQLTYEDFDNLSKSKEVGDDFYQTTYKTFGNFVTWLEAEKAVEENRIGNAPRNYAYDNTKRWYAFRRLIRKSMTEGKKGFIQRLGYSPEIASELSIRQLEVGMQDADYLILRDYERDRLAQEGAMILSKVLYERDVAGNIIMDPVLDDKGKPKKDAQGNEIKAPRPDNAARQKGLSLLDETTWKDQNLRQEVRTALETVRRRGLLEFMREEGFSWYTKNRLGEYVINDVRYLGEKVPEEIRKKTKGIKAA